MSEQVIIYIKPDCPYSAAAKRDFNMRGVAFEERDVTANPAWLEEMERVSGQRLVPTIVEGERVTVGFGGG